MLRDYNSTLPHHVLADQCLVLNENKANKTGDLLKDYDLEDRICSVQMERQESESNLVDIDYSKVDQKLKLAVDNSKKHLFTAIKNAEALRNPS